MTTTSALRAGVLLVLLPALSGCVSFEMGGLKRSVARSIEAQSDAEIGDGFAVSFGRISIGSTRFLTRAVAPNSTAEARQLMHHVRSVKVGRYSLLGAFDGRQIAKPDALLRYERDGWLPFVTVRDSSSAAWVLVRERPRDGRLTDLLTVVVAEDDVVLTKVSGDLSSLVLDAVAMGGDGGFFGGALEEAGIVAESEAETAPDS